MCIYTSHRLKRKLKWDKNDVIQTVAIDKGVQRPNAVTSFGGACCNATVSSRTPAPGVAVIYV